MKRRNWFFSIGGVVLLVVLLMACCSSSSQARERDVILKNGHFTGWSDTRARVLLHWPQQQSGFGELRGHVVLPNVLGDDHSKNCIGYVGVANWLTPNLELEPAFGWRFKTGEAIASLRAKSLWQGGVWSWVCMEYTPATKAGYYFWQCDRAVRAFDTPVSLGLEAEGWLQSMGGWTHGGGPNLIFDLMGRRQISRLELSLAVHYRSFGGGEWKPELFFRFNLFPGGG